MNSCPRVDVAFPMKGSTLEASGAEIARALSVLAQPGQVIELRMLHATVKGRVGLHTVSGYFNDHQGLAKAAISKTNNARGIYITLNPVNPALLARSANHLQIAGKDVPLTSDADVTQRLWLPVDVDPVRPAGISSTEEERNLCIDRAFKIREQLRKENWPDPLVADSGNGAHLLYKIDLPANDGGIVKRCLATLASRFDDDRVKVDQSVYNPARIWRLYGTVSRKGENMPDRPHRLARILETP